MRRAIDPNLKYITIQLKYNNVNQDITFNTQSDYGVCISTLAMKLPIVNGKIREKLAEARRLILCIEFGCDICHPDQGVAYE